jgi:hypothetical protein
MKTRVASLALAAMLLMLTSGVRTADRTLFVELPVTALAYGVGANGSVVVGTYKVPAGFYWMPTTSDIFIGGQGAYAASRDGRVIAGTGIDARRVEQAAIWQRGTEWRLLGSIRPNPVPCGEQLSSTFDTSDAGNVIVGVPVGRVNGNGRSREHRCQPLDPRKRRVGRREDRRRLAAANRRRQAGRTMDRRQAGIVSGTRRFSR